jgi:hypothetical protein
MKVLTPGSLNRFLFFGLEAALADSNGSKVPARGTIDRFLSKSLSFIFDVYKMKK